MNCNYYSLPNGRMVLKCFDCGFSHDLSKYGWLKIICNNCRAICDHPVAGIKSKASKKSPNHKNKTTKTCLMLSDDARSLVHTISSFQDCSQSEAVNLLMKFALDEYHASGGKLIELPKPKTKAK
jgi:hypothetical protein